MAQDCKELIENFRRWNFNKEDFILTLPFLENFKDGMVEAILADSDLEPYLRRELLPAIIKGGKLVLAILVDIGRPSLITNFYKYQNLNAEDLDSSLPYTSIPDLEKIIPLDYLAFYTKQWSFSAPIFRANLQDRVLPDRTVLPYVHKSECIGEGGFGSVYKVRLPAEHQCIGKTAEDVELVLKEMKPGGDESFEEEKRILSLLRGLRNAAIVHFHTSYITRSRIYLLFEVADCNLEEMMMRPIEEGFSLEAVLRSLQGLCLALNDLHNYFSEPDNLTLIGCHYDLRPDNILVKNNKFLLADFGLSRMKPDQLGSKSMFKAGFHDYLAPECQSLTVSAMAKYPIGRASDVWSFGCILAELVIWLALGHEQLDTFVNTRSVRIGHFRVGMFHDGQGNVNPEVLNWLQRVESTSQERQDGKRSRSLLQLVWLVRDILQTNPEIRPTIRQVTVKASIITRTHTFELIDDAFTTLYDISDANFEVALERHRLNTWGKRNAAVNGHHRHLEIQNIARSSDLWNSTHTDDIQQLQKIDELLQALYSEIQRLISCHSDKASSLSPSREFHPIYYSLSQLINQLWSTQSLEDRQEMNSELEDTLLNENFLGLSLNSTLPNQQDARRMRFLLAMKQATRAVHTSQDRLHFYLDLANITTTYTARTGRQMYPFSIGEIAIENTTQRIPIIIEAMEYNDLWLGKEDQLMSRVEGLVSNLNTLEQSGMLPILRCRNFTHDQVHRSFNLVFEIPATAVAGSREPVKPLTLCDLIKESSSRSKRPSLGCMFKLAYTLANTLLSFHKAGWLHKNLTAYNLIFFRGASNSYENIINSPYIVGFNYSRENDEIAFTTPREYTKQDQDYQNPKYLQSSKKNPIRYRQQFDYYSLGMILLEIGRWKPLASMTKGKELLEPDEMLKFLLDKEVPDVSSYMGNVFTHVVIRCLTEDFQVHDPADKDADLQVRTAFYKGVVLPLQRCLGIHE
ncbi:hypothetical protein ABW19_dt0201029 [Dactylella cylindrospora]|nr:hypothetical protein ABW19_dt0201029 [Dactylella cylindrospora]